jgi:hypothetical protein
MSIDGNSLYHYTNPDGLKGILESGTIFATDCRFVNDSQELKHAVDGILIPLLEARAEKSPDKDYYMVQARGFLDLQFKAPYIACFSEKGDQLSQWRGYGSEAGAVSLGFDPQILGRDIISLNPLSGGSLQKVIYLQEEQEQEFLRILGTNDFPWRVFVGSAGLNLGSKLLGVAIRCKHAGFEEEREWRIVIPSKMGMGTGAITKPHDFRTGGKYVAPYVNVKLSRPDEPVPLTEVICAPGDRDGVALDGVRALLDLYGYKDIPVRHSKIPFRG